MDDFYKKIKTSVDGIAEAKPEQSDWKSFQSFREEKNTSKPKAFPWLMLSTLGLITLLIASNIYWATHAFNQSGSQTAAVIHDTIYLTKIIENENLDQIKFIAILEAQLRENEKALAQQLNSYSSLNAQFKVQAKQLYSIQSKFQLQESTLKRFADQEQKQVNDFSVNARIQGQTDLAIAESIRSALSISGLPLLNNGFLDYTRPKSSQAREVIWIENKKPFSLIDLIKPKSLSLNANIGFVHKSNDGFSGANGGALSLYASSLFGRHIRGNIGINYGRIKGHIVNNAYPNIPTIDIPENYVLAELKITQSTIWLEGSVDYLFASINRFRPFVGLGFASSLSTKDQFSFELKGPDGEIYITPESKFNVPNSKYVSYTLGTDFNLNRHFDLSIGATYLQAASSNSKSKVLANTGIYYHF